VGQRKGPPRAGPRPQEFPADARILGAGDLIKPAAPNLASLGPAFLFFASWYILGAIAFWFIGFETKGRSFEEIDRALATPSAAKVRGV